MQLIYIPFDTSINCESDMLTRSTPIFQVFPVYIPCNVY